MDTRLFESLLDLKEKKAKLSGPEITKLFKQYLKEVQGLWKTVDKMENGQ
jgi:ABC-type phosphate transport system auxiliary subunit